jgi:hypothetical protein
MATRKVKLTGIAEWAKVFPQNRDMKGYEGAYEDYNMEALKASRSIKRGSPDPEGRGTKVKFVRKFDTGRDWDSGAPVVKKSDDSNWDFDIDGPIGNGSTVEVLLSVYDTRMKNIVGTRLDMVKVVDHVEYVGNTATETTSPPIAAKTQEGEVLF